MKITRGGFKPMPNIELATEEVMNGARIKVVGVGGGGNNAVDRMIEAGVDKAEFIAINTDAQQLGSVKAPNVLQIGTKLTSGLGAGAKPEIGKQAAEESKDEIKSYIRETEMVFITAGMGGGTGTGAAPVIAEAAKSMGVLTVAVVTKPFFFEGPQRMKNAEEGIQSLRDHVDALVTIPNDSLLKIADKKVSIKDSFKLADDVLRQGVQGIIEVITQEGLINCDFADVKTIMKDSGLAHMGIGIGKGDNAAQDAVRAAIESPLLETSIVGAKNVLLNITGGEDFSLVDMNEVSSLVREMVSQEAVIIVGTAMDESLKDEIKVTLIATGLDHAAKSTSAVNSSIGASTIERIAPKTTSVDEPIFGSERSRPLFNDDVVQSQEEDKIFSRTIKPGIDNINVPSFFRPKNK